MERLSVRLLMLALVGSGLAGVATDVKADEADQVGTSVSSGAESTAVARLRDRDRSAKTVKDWLAQMEAATVQVTGVKLEPSEAGLDIILETAEGKPLTIDATKFRREGNSLVADIPNATLALPQGQAFVADNPTADIATVQVVQQGGGSIRVSVAGKEALPKTEVTLKTGGLAYSLNPEGDEADDELVVTGAGRGAYRVPNASVGTRTDTPIRDIPQSIQVVPQQVIRDQGATRLIEVLENVPGVVQGFRSPRRGTNEFNIRGFYSGNDILINGLQVRSGQSNVDFGSNIDRVEVLKGPASVLFGPGALGGRVNLVTKQPLRDPLYFVEATAGSFDTYRGAIDLSGPLNPQKTILYRLNASAETNESFVDFFNRERYQVSPTLSFLIGDRTKLTFEADYQNLSIFAPDYGLPAEGTILPNPNGKIPRNRYVGEPSFAETQKEAFRIGYDLEHRFSDTWRLRSAFRFSQVDTPIKASQSSRLLADKRTLTRFSFEIPTFQETLYELDNYVVGKFATGSVKHELVFGINLSRLEFLNTFAPTANQVSPIDIFNPAYARFLPGESILSVNSKEVTQGLGLYIQNQIALTDNLKLLLGGRFDIATKRTEDFLTLPEQFQQDEAFSPRIGIIYQPIQPISLYASYSRSFAPQIGSAFNGEQFEPERVTQFEIGVKADLSDRLAATLAFYELTRSNLLTDDPDNIGFSIQTGEQRSRGIEFDLSGEILPGWNIITGYALNDAEITADNIFTVGNKLDNAPRHAFNLWTTYEIQSGELKGLGAGIGIFYVGERQGDLDNSFEIPGYTRTDAAIFYRRGQFRAAINFRNLFNIDYFVSAQNRNRVYYGDPFTMQGTISWEF